MTAGDFLDYPVRQRPFLAMLRRGDLNNLTVARQELCKGTLSRSGSSNYEASYGKIARGPRGFPGFIAVMQSARGMATLSVLYRIWFLTSDHQLRNQPFFLHAGVANLEEFTSSHKNFVGL